MRIGEMVRRTGVSERLLRYYEEQGLLAPARLPSGYRVYEEADVATVRNIRTLLAAGLSTSTIARVLPCVRDDGPRLVPTCTELMAELRRERERIARTIDDLRTPGRCSTRSSPPAPPDGGPGKDTFVGPNYEYRNVDVPGPSRRHTTSKTFFWMPLE
ncbi:MerR family transcriptional regulator [Actinomadura sp. CNU-125]|uniref:MerR family transcriptional regulator n=1 Tax=Actinomadura sp. CNU-125 TaxID=1904961 RepID=UPI0009F86096|nr:MerR family transcriptional regulator [Actinomadura sp. CNU-125]